MRLLILGASGFLGRHVWQQATVAGAEVITAGRGERPESPAHRRLDLAAGEPARIAELVASVAPDVVANCAGATTGGPDLLAAVNVTGTYALVRAMLLAGTPARLVHLGSAAEYGRVEPGVAVAESAPGRPVAAYGATKLAGTRLVELARAAGLDAVVLRVFNPVGAGAPGNSLAGRVAAELRRALADNAGGAGGAGWPAAAAATCGSARWTRSATSSTPATSPPRCSRPRPPRRCRTPCSTSAAAPGPWRVRW